MGYLARYDRDCWRATFDDILRYVSKPGKARCSAKVIDWLAEVYAKTATTDPEEPLQIQQINRIGISVLELEDKYLTVREENDVEQIRSTPRCQRELNVRIRVDSPVLEDGAAKDDVVAWLDALDLLET